MYVFLLFQDKDILQVIVKQKTKSCLCLILRNENNVEQDVRLKIGQNISKVVDRNCTINTTYPDVFFVNESEVEKRIAFLLEVQINAMIKEHVKSLPESIDFPIQNGLTQSNEAVLYEQNMNLLCTLLPKKDRLLILRHKLEVLLHRYLLHKFNSVFIL